MARAKQVHVVYSKKWAGWLVKMGNQPMINTIGWLRQEDAISAGRMIAKQHKGELVIHNKQGKIRKKHSYGNDPRSIKG